MCYVGPWCKEQFRTIAKGYDADAEIVLISGYKSLDQSGLISTYYDLLKNVENYDISLEDCDDKILRCRLLRELEEGVAKHHLGCMTSAVSETLAKFKPDLVISECIDSYRVDVLHAECIKHGIQFIGLVPVFINGYFRVTAKGEYNHLREPPIEEVSKVLDIIEKNNYRPDFVSGSVSSLKFSILKRWSKNLLRPAYFFSKRVLSGDKYNNHYWGGQLVTTKALHVIPRLFLGDSEWKEKIENSQKPVIYIPLQHIPEATVDYWCEDINVIEYELVLDKVIKQLSSDFNFVIKEHPNVIGLRHPEIYRKLDNLASVTMCPVNVNSNQLIDMADAVLVWTGTVGFEAALRGKPVLLLSKAYYVSGKMFKVLGGEVQSKEILRFIAEVSGTLSEIEKKEMLAYVLKGVFPGKFKNNGAWRKNNESDIVDAISIGSNLAIYSNIRNKNVKK
jgi:hypothetical protein